jgi:hypothetical protein
MLVLSAKKDGSITVRTQTGETMSIRIVSGSNVRLGFEAPESVRILRDAVGRERSRPGSR